MAEKKAKSKESKETKVTKVVEKKVKVSETPKVTKVTKVVKKATKVVEKKVKTKEVKETKTEKKAKAQASKDTEAKTKATKAPVQDDTDKIAGFPAKVVDLVGRTGVRGEIVQVRCEVLEGRDAGKVLIRNVKSPVKAGDILLLSETAMQARKLEARR